MNDTISEVSPIVVTARRTLRRPRGRVHLDDQLVPGLIELTVVRTNYFNADTFDASYVLNQPGFGPNWWLDRDQPIPIKIEIGFENEDGQTDWRELLTGQVDDVRADYGGGRVQITGRDKTALLIDNKVQRSFRNQTASEIVTQIASARGLQVDATATSSASGTFYQREHTSTHADTFKNATEWDAIVHLARCEGYDAWVDGDTLNFHPLAPHDDPYQVSYSFNEAIEGISIAQPSDLTRLIASHNLNLAKDIRVVVRSYHSGMGRGFEAEAGTPSGEDDDKGMQEHVFVIPNLTEPECQQRADRLYDEMTRHEYLIEFEAPASTRLDPRKGVRISGVEGIMDQDYFVDEVRLSLRGEGGFVMSVRAKNHPEPSGDQ